MKIETKNKLLEAYDYCTQNGKSTEYTLQYLQDFANIDLDCVLKFLRKKGFYEVILKEDEK